MKKVILGFVSISCVGLLIYGLQGSHLAAQEETATSQEMASSVSQEIPEVAETVPSSEAEVAPVVPEEPEEPSVPSGEEPAEPEASSSEEVTEETEASSEAETSTPETESSASTEEPTETTESTTETTESTIESSTEETTSTSSSTSSSSAESSTNSSTTTESSTTPSSSKPAESKKPETSAPAAKPAPSVNPGPALAKPVGPTLDPNYVPQLSEDLEVAKLQPSNLAGYELPLLAEFSDTRQAAVVYAGIQLLGVKQADDFVTDTFTQQLWKEMFDRDLATLEAHDVKKADLLPGDLLYKVTEAGPEIQGVVLDETHYLTVEKVKLEDEKLKNTEATTEANQENQEKTENQEKQEVQEEMQVVAKPLALADEDHLQVKRETEHALTEAGNKVVASYPADQPFKANATTQSFIDSIGDSARELGLKYDVFSSVMIAQAILESGSGSSGLASAPNYNLFGVKGSYQGSSVELSTQEDRGNGELYTINAAFRRYPNYTASLGDYVQLIRGGISGNDNFYKGAWRTEAKNYLLATRSLTGKYATDTLYHKKLNSLIAVYNLTQFDQPKSETGVFIKGKNEIPAEYAALMKYPDYNGINYNTSGSYPVGQCTWYAFNRAAQLGGKVDNFMGNGGEWGAKGAALGYKVTQVPEAGTLISFKPGVAGSSSEYGHVAFVEAVGANGILISEGNVYGGTVISYRVIPNDLAYSNLVSYITPK